MSKCPVCQYDIEDNGIKVRVQGKEQVVCCQECADKLLKEAKPVAEK
jgi:hypothetical protein